MSERKQTPPHVEASGDGKTFTESHPSYALIGLSRWSSGGGRSFFGSSIEPHAGVSLSISVAEKKRNLSNTWYHTRGEIIQVDMTEAQFAQMITSFNIGCGVPCTLSHLSKSVIAKLPDGIIPECPETNERKLVEQEFAADMKRLGEQLAVLVKKAQELQEKPSVTKADRKLFTDIAQSIQSIVSASAPFIQKQFNEALDDTVTQAKADVDAFLTQLLRTAGMEAIRDRAEAMRPAFLKPLDEIKSMPPAPENPPALPEGS